MVLQYKPGCLLLLEFRLYGAVQFAAIPSGWSLTTQPFTGDCCGSLFELWTSGDNRDKCMPGKCSLSIIVGVARADCDILLAPDHYKAGYIDLHQGSALYMNARPRLPGVLLRSLILCSLKMVRDTISRN